MPSPVKWPTLDYPRQIRLDTISRCNANCLSCHRHNQAAKMRTGIMPIEQVLGYVKQIASDSQHPEELVPVNYGEFFMHPDWAEILRCLQTYLPQTGLVIPTNSSLLNEAKLRQLVEIKTLKLVNFSVNAFWADSYKRFMGLEHSNYSNIVRANDYLRIHRPEIQRWVSMVSSPDYQTDLERDMFAEFWQPKVSQVWIIQAANCGRYPVQYVVNAACRSIFDTLVIGYDDKLSLCCFDAGFELDLGEWHGSVREAWNNPKIRLLRKAHNAGERSGYSVCAKCSFA